MTQNIEKTLGIEIHLAIFNKKKAFSPTPTTECSWTSLGFPGTLPQINFEAVKTAIRLANTLKMTINHSFIAFDRKNYFYYDLPRGYQITQFFHPIGTNGYIELASKKRIRIKQIHLEEDSAKQTKHGHTLSLSFERLGNPIIELVSEPDFSTHEEVEEFLKIFREMSIFLNISSCQYEEGEMRVDLNISCTDTNSKISYPKSEVKNLNSVNAIQKSIDWLYDDFCKKINSKEDISSYTYTWLDKFNTCQIIREKGDSKKYFYVPEANIPPLILTPQEVKNILSKEGDYFVFNQEIHNELTEKEANNMLSRYDLFHHIKELNSSLKNWKKSYLWIASTVEGILNTLDNKQFNKIELFKLIQKIESTKINSSKISKEMIKEVVVKKLTAKEAFKAHKIVQITSTKILQEHITEILGSNVHQLEKLARNATKLEKFVLGQLQAKTSGQANPITSAEVYRGLIKTYLESKGISNFEEGN